MTFAHTTTREQGLGPQQQLARHALLRSPTDHTHPRPSRRSLPCCSAALLCSLAVVRRKEGGGRGRCWRGGRAQPSQASHQSAHVGKAQPFRRFGSSPRHWRRHSRQDSHFHPPNARQTPIERGGARACAWACARACWLRGAGVFSTRRGGGPSCTFPGGAFARPRDCLGPRFLQTAGADKQYFETEPVASRERMVRVFGYPI